MYVLQLNSSTMSVISETTIKFVDLSCCNSIIQSGPKKGSVCGRKQCGYHSHSQREENKSISQLQGFSQSTPCSQVCQTFQVSDEKDLKELSDVQEKMINIKQQIINLTRTFDALNDHEKNIQKRIQSKKVTKTIVVTTTVTTTTSQ